MAKALKTTALVLGAAALVVATGGAAAGLGLSLGTSVLGVSAGGLLAGSALASTASGLLTKTPQVPAAQTDRLTANIDPRAYRKTVLGQTAFPVDVRYEEWSGADQEYCDWIVALASHAIDGVEEIWLNTELAWSQATGVTAKFAGYFSVPNLVLEGSPANAFSFASGRWNGSARLTGCAYARLRFKVTGNSKKATSPFSSGIPNRITIIGRGAKLYDPRRDSTVAGGSGPMRWNDQSTWRYTADDGAVIGENLPLHILRVALGWRIRNPATGEMKLATGSGVPGRRLRLESWIEAANLADELVNRSAGGQEPRYHGAGVVSEGEDPGTTYDALCAACNGRFRDTHGKLSLAIAHNDLAAAATDDGLNDDDVIGGFTFDPDAAVDATPNVVRGQYVDATSGSLYQLVDYPEVRIASPDGQDRVLTLNLGFCESPSQAQRIAKQVLQRLQYQREFTAPFDIRAWKYPVGALVPLTYAPLSFGRRLFRVKAQELGQDGVCNMTLSFEHQAIYQWDRDDAAPVLAAEPIAYDAARNPMVLAIADLDTQVTQILSDNVITRGREKRDLILQWQGIVAQFNALDDRFDGLGAPANIKAARDSAEQRVGTLGDLLTRLVPAWDNVTVDTPVDGAALGAAWQAARERIEVFGAAITGIEGPPGKDGASAFNLVGATQSTIVGPNSVRGTAGAGWGTEAAYSLEAYTGGATVSYRLLPLHGDSTLVGLATGNPGADGSNGPSSVSFGLLRFQDGQTSACVNGNPQNNGPVVNGAMEGRVDFDGRYARWYVNGAIIYAYDWLGATGDAAAAQNALRFRAALAGNDPRVQDISFVARGRAGADGASAPLVRTQWSIDGATNWHDNYFGADRYARQSNDNGATWGPAELRIGERGNAGTDGKYTSYVYLRSFTVPPAPGNNTGDPPPGWTDAPTGTAANGYLFQTESDFRNGVQLIGWSAPVRIDGEAGKDGFALSADHTEFNIPAFSNGAIKPSWGGAGGTLSLNRGGYTQIDGVTYALLTNQNVTGVSVSGRNFSFTGVTGEKGSFVIRATYGGQPYDVRIDAKKTLDGAAAFQNTVPINGNGGGSQVTVPAGRQARVTANADYYPGNGYGGRTGQLQIFVRNVTDNGPETLLAQATGSTASRYPNSNSNEPDVETNGTVSVASDKFTTASPDKLYAFRAAFDSSGSGGFTLAMNGSIKLEVTD